MSRYIGSTATVQPTQASAGGVYTLKDQLVYNAREQWPVARDPYFNYTTLLLQGDVPYTRGRSAMTLPLAYNSDASANNFLITPNGDVGPRPFSPYFGGNYSVYFDGTSGQYLNTPSNAAFAVGTGNFTLEAWVYLTGTNFCEVFTTAFGSVPTTATYRLLITTTQKLFYSDGTNSATSTASIALNTWTHVCVVREGTGTNQTKLYINGLQDGATTSSNNLTNSTGYIGRTWDGFIFTGYISNLRLVKGTAVYTSNFTPPTQPLQNITNTSLLTCQSNRFIDNSTANSGSGFTITVNGSPRITDNSPFVSTDFTTGAGYFDGSDYLTAGSASDWTFLNNGSSWTIQFSLYYSGTSAQTILSTNAASASVGFTLGINDTAANELNVVFYRGVGGSFANFRSNAALVLNSWNIIAITFDTSTKTCSFYINGVAQGSSSNTGFAYSSSNPAYTLAIGRFQTASPGGYYTGYISDLKISNNVRTGLTTVPTALFTSDANTSLLTLQTRAPSQNISFLDSSPNEFLITKSGNTTQGTFSPFSPTGWGNYFNGSNAYLNTATSADFAFGTGDFQIEFFFFPQSSTSQRLVYFSVTDQNQITCDTNYNTVYWDGTNLRTIGTATANAWNHVVVAKSSGAVSCWLNGTRTVNALTDSSNTGSNRAVYLGATNTGTERLTGYLSNVKILKGLTTYSGATINVPTAPLAFTANTVLLTCQSNRFLDQTGKTITSTNASVQAFSPFAPQNAVSPLVTGGSGYFDGNGDYLTTPNVTTLNLYNTTNTVECWIYPLSFATNLQIYGTDFDGTYYTIWDITSTTGYPRYFPRNGTVITASSGITLNQWNHVVWGRSGTTVSIWINGTRFANGTISVEDQWGTGVITIGRFNGENRMNGYLSGLRVVKGTDVYGVSNTSITVPTTPPTAIPNTSLLLNFTNGAAVDATGKNNLESVGNAQNSGVQAKWDPLRGGSSILFNPGQTNPLIIPSRQLFNLASGDFTIEAWVYLLSNRTYNFIISKGNAGTREWGVNVGPTELRFYWSTNGSSTGDSIVAGSATLPIGVWMHVAVTRSVNSIRLFKDGNQVGSTGTFTSMYSGTDPVYVGRFMDFTNISHDLDGYLSNLRITKGIARYTTNFNTNLPTGPFPRG